MIGWALPPKSEGGLDVYCMHIARHLSKEHEVYLAIPQFNVPESPPDMGDACIMPIEFARGNTLLDDILSYNRAIVSYFSGEHFDVVHSNDWFGVMAANRFKEYFETPFVLALHSLQYMRSALPERVDDDIGFVERYGIQNSDVIVTVSRMMKNEIMKSYRVSPDKIFVIPNGGGFENEGDRRIFKKKHGIKGKVVLYIGRLSRQKGVEYLLLAARKVIKSHPDTVFFIGGEGHMRRQLEMLVEIFGIKDNVIFGERINESELSSYFASCDIFVSPSVWEPFGITVTEAMSQKRPVIATMGTGSAEDMESGRELIKVRPKSSDAIAKAIIMLLENEDMQARIGNAGYEFCKKNFSWKKSAKALSRVYSFAADTENSKR